MLAFGGAARYWPGLVHDILITVGAALCLPVIAFFVYFEYMVVCGC